MQIKRLALLGFALGLLLLMLPVSTPAHAQTSSTPGISVVEEIQPVFDVYGSTTNHVTIVINASSSIVAGPGGSFSVQTLFRPHPLSVVGANETGPPTISGGLYTTNFLLNPGSRSFYVAITGSEPGATFLWRYIGAVPLVSFSGLSGSEQVYVTVPRGTILSQIYQGNGESLPLSDSPVVSSGGAGVTYSPVPGVVRLMIFQSTAFIPASIAITVMGLVLLGLVAVNFFTTGKRLIDSISGRVKEGLRDLHRLIPFGGSRNRFRIRSIFQPRKLLALFILCAILMVALGALGGPDPRVKAYVIASPSATAQIQGQLQHVAGNVLVLTPSNDFTDFNVMSSVGEFNIVVITNTSAGQIDDVRNFVLPYLGNVPVIMVDSTVSPDVTSSIQYFYSGQYLSVQDATNLTPGQQTQLTHLLGPNLRSNALGFHLGNTEFKAILASEAVLSMVLVFLGWAYLGSLASESRTARELPHLVVIVAAGVFVFFFSETIYVVTSSMLGVPLSLHAVNSNAHDLTAIGLLGFGGGSTPRLAAGFLGVLVGAVGVEEGLTVSKRDFAIIAGLGLFLFANPLYIGQYVYQAILLFFPLGSLVFGDAYASSLTFKGFIYGVGDLLGGGVTPTFLLSAGKMLFFAGLVPLASIRRMGRTTTAIAVLVVSLIVGDGGVRVGEMTPDKTVAAVVPGLIAGFAFVVVLLAITLVEKYVRGNWKSHA